MSEEKWTAARIIAKQGVKHFEGCHLTSYILKGETWATLGWGEAIPLAQHPKTITQAEADARFEKVFARKEAQLRSEIPAAVLDKQTVGFLAGLLMFRYNVKDSTWLANKPGEGNTRKALIAGDIAKFKRMHLTWVRGASGPLPGLQRRRKVEGDLMNGITLDTIKKANWYIKAKS